ncbi:MAG: fused response regulator/phosphatase [Rhodocyclaceae bacterium]|nr:fused response regulator/phosphatase [Rhodocyclaceae bacterium]
MKILLVDDNPDDRRLARHELMRLGHDVVDVDDATRVLALFERERPDVVVTDIAMAGMDGFTLTREVQRRAAPRWQPVLFLSGQRDDALRAQAIRAGADGYVTKPVSAPLLDASLKLVERLLAAQRGERERGDELAKCQAAAEEERRVAAHLLRRLVIADKLDDPALCHWLSAAAVFGGDLIAAARTPGRTLHVLLADGPGRGLAAAVNVLPIIAPFYRMTEKGFGIDAIVREMNAKVRQFLPAGRFVAATVAAIDFREAYVRLWNGGNPAPLLLSAAGEVEATFALRHLPLGVLVEGEFEATTETHAFGAERQLVIYSDGLIEAENAAGEPFGGERLKAALAGAAPPARVAGTIAAVAAHCGAAATADDVAMILVRGQPELAAVDPPQAAAPLVAATEQRCWRFSLRLGARELRTLDVVPLLLGLVGQFEGARHCAGELFVVLSELFNNALDHGLLLLDSRQKLDPEGMERFLREREARLALLGAGEIELELEQFEHAGGAWLRIVCRDTGPGFAHAALERSAAADGDLPFGRGLALVRAMSSSFEFNDIGNAATVVLALKPTAAGANPDI